MAQDWDRNVRNSSLERAEQMMEESALDTKTKIGQVRSFSDFFILRFRCEDCQDFHFWGGMRKYMMTVDFELICPKGSKKVRLNQKFSNVTEYDALHFAPLNIRKLMIEDLKEKQLFK